MPTLTRIYAVENSKDSSITLVQASTPAQARGHVARLQYSATVATQKQLVELVQAGAKVQVANDDQADDEIPAEVITGKK